VFRGIRAPDFESAGEKMLRSAGRRHKQAEHGPTGHALHEIPLEHRGARKSVSSAGLACLSNGSLEFEFFDAVPESDRD
jgi:hypothetical protein